MPCNAITQQTAKIDVNADILVGNAQGLEVLKTMIVNAGMKITGDYTRPYGILLEISKGKDQFRLSIEADEVNVYWGIFNPFPKELEAEVTQLVAQCAGLFTQLALREALLTIGMATAEQWTDTGALVMEMAI